MFSQRAAPHKPAEARPVAVGDDCALNYHALRFVVCNNARPQSIPPGGSALNQDYRIAPTPAGNVGPLR